MFTKSWSEIDNKSKGYYDKVITLCKQKSLPTNLSFIVVDHCLQTFESHVESLTKLGKIAGVILKSSTRVDESERFARHNCNLIEVTKESLKCPEIAMDIILKHTSENDQVVILDHGGYFAQALPSIIQHPLIKHRLLGLVEVTENGHAKLEKVITKTNIRAISIARSELKELEDMQVGVSICDVSNSLLYPIHCALTSLNSICVIGYGKIGRSIANHCRKMGISSVTVMEIDSLRAQFALKEGHKVILGKNLSEAKISAFRSAQMIFSSTGCKALSKADIPFLRKTGDVATNRHKSVLFIASCTSPDDEFSEDFFPELASLSVNTPVQRQGCEDKYKLTPYELYDGRDIYILNSGKSVNFALGGTPGYEICQVWAAIVYAAAKIAAKEVDEMPAVQSLTKADQQEISAITHAVYFAENNGKLLEKPKGMVRSNSVGSFPASSAASVNTETDNDAFQLRRARSSPF